MTLSKVTLAVALAFSSQAYAATDFSNFTPLTGSQTTALPEATPLLLSSPNFIQERIADRSGSGVVGQKWDMIDADASGRYLFMPFEESNNAGVMRVDLQDSNYATRTTTIVANGTQDFSRGDASLTASWGGYLTAEESWGTGSTHGRLFEVTNPITATENAANFVHRSVLPRVAHEGLAFDAMNNLYFVDEFSGGSVYKYTSANPNATTGNDYFAAGQTFVAQVNGSGTTDATGGLMWAAITDVNGAALANSVLSVQGDIDGRASADAYGGTNYQRPEDLEIKTLASGDEALFSAMTGTDNVFLFNLGSNQTSVFADRNTIDLATGLAVGADFNNPDNLAVDAAGNIYIVEDQGGAVNGDIWFTRDLNNDGDLLDAGEGIARWASNGTPGSELTGLYFDEHDSNIAFVNIQHPSTSNDSLIRIAAVPEPSSYALMLAGLGLMGFVARRKNQK